MRPILTVLFLISASTLGIAQDMTQVRSDIDRLTSEDFYGRGYVHRGDRKAAEFIVSRFREIGLQPVNGKYLQPFVMNVNTVTATELLLNGKELRPGLDYIVHPSSGSAKVKISGLNLEKRLALASPQQVGKLEVANLKDFNATHQDKVLLLIDADSNLTASLAGSARTLPALEVLPQHFPEILESVKLEVKTKMKKLYVSNNVVGMIRGTEYPDSVVILSGHYDHLGGYAKGDVYFPGANDNASGISMLLQLAQHFSLPENRAAFSILFVAFGGEEAGLLGSKYFVNSPPIPFSHISFVLNLDIISTGDIGITVVNGSIYKDRFAVLDSLNSSESLLPRIGSRGKAANSDHYFFSEMGVPSFFIYTEGAGRTYYHDVRDEAGTLPLSKYSEVYRLLTLFIPTQAGG